MRLFIAIAIDRPFREEAAEIQRQLKLMSAGGKFVPPENFHITLKFIGESRDIAGAAEAMGEAVRGIRPICLRLGSYGWLEKGGRGRTAILGIEGDTGELTALHQSLESALYDRGFPREHRRFTPHLTLGRGVEHDDISGAELMAIKPSAAMTAREITLFESLRDKGRVIYRPIHRERF